MKGKNAMKVRDGYISKSVATNAVKFMLMFKSFVFKSEKKHESMELHSTCGYKRFTDL